MGYSALFEPVKLRIVLLEVGALLTLFPLAFLGLHFWKRRARPDWLAWVEARQMRSILFVILTALVGRATLLPFVGIPSPRVNDEFSHLLAADTFSHHRVTNPTPADWQHFETFHVNIQPTYHSMYPVAQGMVLAFGQVAFHQPWIGVYLATALMCGAFCWALRAFFPPGWALLGGTFAVFRFALFSYWMNSYWGGSVAALGGAIALGAVVRLCEAHRTSATRVGMSCLFAVGLVVLANSRPYEGLVYSLPLFGYLVYKSLTYGVSRSKLSSMLLPALLIGLAALGGMGFYNHATTGNVLLMPYSLNHSTAWPLPFFMGQQENHHARIDDPVFDKYFRTTAEVYEYEKTKSLEGIVGIELSRIIQNWFFYVGPALTFPVAIGLLLCLKHPRLRLTAFLFAATSLAIAACNFNFVHYFAPAAILIYIFAIEGLRYLWDTEHRGERAFVVAVCATVVVTACMRLSATSVLYTRYAIADGRKAVMQQLQEGSTKYLVLVSYDLERHYPGAELVHNGADFGSEKILWARSKGREADAKLCEAYGDRMLVSITTDDLNLSLKHLPPCR